MAVFQCEDPSTSLGMTGAFDNSKQPDKSEFSSRNDTGQKESGSDTGNPGAHWLAALPPDKAEFVAGRSGYSRDV